jgi:hypothetical protein
MNNSLTHEQAIQFLHEAAQHLSADQKSDLAAHLAQCDRCRNYADQLNALQPLLTRALRARRYARISESGATVRAILQIKRRSMMRKQVIALLGTAVVAVIAIVAVFSTRIPTRSMTGAQPIATTTPTMIPSPTPTAVPTSTPLPSPLATGDPFQSPLLPAGADRFEPNNNFDQATTIELNVKYDKLNFVQPDINSSEWDNDFFKVRVKPGMLITCRTLDLSPDTDTNLILYDENLNGINGNDDVDRAAGDLSSSATYAATYEGWLYVLIGEGFSRTPAQAQQTTYSLECSTSK